MSAFAGDSSVVGVGGSGGGDAAFAAHGSAQRGRRFRRLVLAATLLGGVLAAGAYQAMPAGHSTAAGRAHATALAQSALLNLPETARAPVSAALGKSSLAYGVRPSAGGFAGSNPAQRLRAAFAPSGMSISAGTASVHLRLLAAGYGSALNNVGTVAPRAHGNRVTYAHTGLNEWYVNGPLGIEQGFTVPRTGQARNAGTLTLAVAVSGNVRASLARSGRAISLTQAGRRVLRYAGLSASDARGHALGSWLSLESGRILLHVDARGAQFPLRVDPLVQEQSLTAAGGAEVGSSVALSSDGNTALVGAENLEGFGAAFVFVRTGAVWKQQALLEGSGESGHPLFGQRVALSADGNTALIGGPLDNFGKGAAWVFTRSGEKWSQQGPKLMGSEESAAQPGFGRGLALSADGNLALIGGAGESVGSTIVAGAVWAFARSEGKWSQQGGKITAKGECCSGAEGGEFGFSIALNSEANIALIGAPIEEEEGNPGAGERGSVYVFARSGESWSQQGSKITPTGEAGEGQFGVSVALNSEATTALVGAPGDNPPKGFGPGVGAAWVFTRSGKKWTQQGEKLLGAEESGREGMFGRSVALSASGNLALIGGPGDHPPEEFFPGDGAAWVFTRAEEKWTQQGEKLTATGEAGDAEFGHSVALSSDGKTALLGAPVGTALNGAAFAFVKGATISEQAAREITQTAGLLTASVNPGGEEVTSCKFEYGTTTAYGSTAACNPAKPGSGESPVAVSAALSGLAVNTTYHFRLAASNAFGTSFGTDATFTTLATFATGETTEVSKPAEAKDGQLTAKAKEGTGKVTIGPYGADIGGAPLFKSSNKYIDVYRGTKSSFATIEFKDCELGGAKAVWWDNPHSGWQPIPEPPAVYTESPTPCITVTLTESTKPSVAELIGTRFGFGEGAGAQEYGKCEPMKKGLYSEGSCLTTDEKNGKPKGTFEWLGAPAACFPLKHGRYAEAGCLTLDIKKEKPKGKWELGSNAFTASAASTKFEGGAGTLTCEASSSEGQLQSTKVAIESITYRGCKRESTQCASAGAPAGTIHTEQLETLSYIENGKFFTGVAGNPIMKYICGGIEYTLHGEVSGETTGDLNAMSTHSESVFKPGVGFQSGLRTETASKSFETTMTSTVTTTSSDGKGFEISETSKQPGD